MGDKRQKEGSRLGMDAAYAWLGPTFFAIYPVVFAYRCIFTVHLQLLGTAQPTLGEGIASLPMHTRISTREAGASGGPIQ